MISRRGLITGLVSLIAAPAIVRASSLMPVKSIISGAELSGVELPIGELLYLVQFDERHRVVYEFEAKDISQFLIGHKQ